MDTLIGADLDALQAEAAAGLDLSSRQIPVHIWSHLDGRQKIRSTVRPSGQKAESREQGAPKRNTPREKFPMCIALRITAETAINVLNHTERRERNITR